LNELQAAHKQGLPQALVPAGSPMALLNGYNSAAQINVYRKMIDEPLVSDDDAAFTVTYCQRLNALGAPRIINNKARLAKFRSPVNNTDNMFNYMVTRYNAAFTALQCAYLGVTITSALATQTPAANNFPVTTVAPTVVPTQAVTIAPVTNTGTTTTMDPNIIVAISIGAALAVAGVVGGVILMRRRNKRNEAMLLTSTSDPDTYI